LGGEAWIDKRMNLARVVQLPRGGRCTRRPETLQSEDVSENPSPQQNKDTRWKLRTTSEQVPFNESEWAMIALHHFLEHPELRSRIKNLLMDTVLDTLRTFSRSLGASPRCPEISSSECNSKEKTLSMSESGNHRGSVAQVHEPHDPQTRDPEFEYRSGHSFAEIVRNRTSKKTKERKNEKRGPKRQKRTFSKRRAE